MKRAILTCLIFLAVHAGASVECGGPARDGSFVTLTVDTEGARGEPGRGEVVIERNGNRFGYRLAKNEISQFFEYDDPDAAMVGALAHSAGEYPVTVRYVGPNFIDMDLRTVIENGKTDALRGNVLRVWKGPGHAGTDQLQVTNLACSILPSI